jgi:hypothetical protein
MRRSERKSEGWEHRGNQAWVAKVWNPVFRDILSSSDGKPSELNPGLPWIHTNSKQLLGGNFMEKRDKPVAISRQNLRRFVSASQKFSFSWSQTAFFIFADPQGKSFCKDMASDIEQSFQAAAQVGLKGRLFLILKVDPHHRMVYL